MKKAEIKVGGLYRAKVAGKLTTVRVEGIEDRPYGAGKAHTAYHVWNLLTGRKTTFRSAAKFRCEAQPMSDPLKRVSPTDYADKFKRRIDDAATHTTGEQPRPIFTTLCTAAKNGCHSPGEQGSCVLCGEAPHKWSGPRSTDAGPTSPSGNREHFTSRPDAGPAAAAPAGPVVAAEVAGDGEPKQLDPCGNEIKHDDPDYVTPAMTSDYNDCGN